MAPEGLVMVGSYEYRLVALSVLISVLAAYAVRDLSDRIRDARGRVWLALLVGGAVVDGLGTWSMHYTGMLAFRLPVRVDYDWPTVALSLVVGIIGSAATLLLLSNEKMTLARAWPASIFLGCVGISGLHYTAMEAMRFQGMHRHTPGLVILAVVLAVLISWMAQTLRILFGDESTGRRWRSHGWAVLRGMANPVICTRRGAR